MLVFARLWQMDKELSAWVTAAPSTAMKPPSCDAAVAQKYEYPNLTSVGIVNGGILKVARLGL